MFLVLRGCESLTFGDATPFIEQVFFEQIEAYTWNFRHFPPWFKRDGRLSCFFFWFVASSPGVGQKYWCGWSHFGRTSFLSFWSKRIAGDVAATKIVVLSCLIL